MPQKRWPTGSRTKSPPSALHIVTNGKKAGGYAAKGPRLQVFLDKEEHPLLTLVGRGVYLFLRTFHEQKCSNSHKNKQKVKEPKLQKTRLNKGKPQFQARNWGFCSGGPEGIRTIKKASIQYGLLDYCVFSAQFIFSAADCSAAIRICV